MSVEKKNIIDLTTRERSVFCSIVRNFIFDAKPIGSRYIEKNCGINISSATIRNVMADLEEKGLIHQPHTSAGRIPTDKGYRYYVDAAMEVDGLTRRQKTIIEKIIHNSKDVETILEQSSRALGNISSLLGVVLAPRFYLGVFEKIELVDISDNRLLAVLKIKSGLVKTILLEIHAEFGRDKLEETARVLNERLYGLTLLEIKNSIDLRMADVAEGDPLIIRHFVDSADKVFNFKETDHLHASGTGNIAIQPEFSDKHKMSSILKLLDQKEILVQVLNDHGQKGGVSIIIGEENREELMQTCSFISASYNLGDVTGTLGVLGPTRMEYAKVVALVEYMSQVLAQVIKDRQVV